ncbi:MAG: hypothetical protein K1000chlam3_00588 [Chlamydiae bacterium]|nr:hypothetical protein [Chlamydiota bacterium]
MEVQKPIQLTNPQFPQLNESQKNSLKIVKNRMLPIIEKSLSEIEENYKREPLDNRIDDDIKKCQKQLNANANLIRAIVEKGDKYE